jgi:hypothetical protein
VRPTEGMSADYLEAEEATEVDGTMTLTVAISGDASRPFDQRWTMDMSMDVTFTEDDIAIGVDATIGTSTFRRRADDPIEVAHLPDSTRDRATNRP